MNQCDVSFTEYYSHRILPVHHIGKPIEQQCGWILILSLNRLMPCRTDCLRISQGFDECISRSLKELLR